jgi:hypothetical protein
MRFAAKRPVKVFWIGALKKTAYTLPFPSPARPDVMKYIMPARHRPGTRATVYSPVGAVVSCETIVPKINPYGF